MLMRSDETDGSIMRTRTKLLAAAVTATMVAITGTSWATTAEPAPSWEPCPADGVPVECTRVSVPVDWSRPGGPVVSLKVARLKATGTRIGSVLTNPGGPGGSGVEFLARFAGRFGEQLRRSYDIVSWDPRGVGASQPVTCPAGADRELAELPAPSTLAERLRWERAAATWAAACRRQTGPLFDHVDTLSNVRDLDRLRELLGEPKLNYAGFSYGTRIGLFYADVFPARVGRLAVDAVVDPTSDNADFYDGASRALEQAFTDYHAGCAGRAACPLTDLTAGQARDWLKPLLASSGELGNDIPNMLRDPRGWPALDVLLGKLRDGTWQPSADQPTFGGESYHAVQCLDLPDHRTARQVMADAARADARYPLFGRLAAATVVCGQWPVPPTWRPAAPAPSWSSAPPTTPPPRTTGPSRPRETCGTAGC
jgi:pimeloyl-ACP methyl ester carboxylesterase